MENESTSPGAGAALGRWWGHSPQPSPSTDVMNQLCRVCGEPAAGFHFGAFTCEGCKESQIALVHSMRREWCPSNCICLNPTNTFGLQRRLLSFFGRTYNNLGSITECKNNGECVINKKNRTACKACRLRKCLLVGMSKSGSRYGRRSNWFKIHCLLQEQQQAVGAGAHLKDKSALAIWGESYKNLTTPPAHFDSDSKGSPTEENISLNNNSVNNDRERSPTTVLPSSVYPAEAAAALWAARHSLFPMQLPHHHMPSLPMPFIPPFANFPPPGHPQPQRNLLLPFIQNFHSAPSPQSNHQPLTSASPSRSPSIYSQSPSPSRNHRRNSSPGSDHPREEKSSPGDKTTISTLNHHHPKERESPNRRLNVSNNIVEEHSLALLRSLGPMQETPMDLSVRVIEMKNRRKNKTSQRIAEEGEESESENSDSEVIKDVKDEVSELMDNNDENFNKRKTPLDLTKSTKVEM